MPELQKELDPKLVVGIIVGMVLIAGGVLFTHFRTPADFSGPRVEIKAPKGFAIPTVGGAPKGQAGVKPPPAGLPN